MSHSYLGLYGFGRVDTGIPADWHKGNLTESTHIRLHSYMGGDKNDNRCTEMMIGRGHNYESGTVQCTINMTKTDVALLITHLSAWLAGTESSDDYGTMPEIDLSHIPHEDNFLDELQLKQELARRRAELESHFT